MCTEHDSIWYMAHVISSCYRRVVVSFPKETGSYTDIGESHWQHGESKHTLNLIGSTLIIRCFDNPDALFMLEALEGDTLSIIHLSNTNGILLFTSKSYKTCVSLLFLEFIKIYIFFAILTLLQIAKRHEKTCEF